MYNAGDLRKGLKLLIDGAPHIIIAFDFVKPGKGQALYKTKMKNMINGIILDRTYRSGETFEPANLDNRMMQFLYKDGDGFHFMDNKNYEQFAIPEDVVGDAANFLKDNMEADVLLFDDRPIGVELPNFVNLRVTETQVWAKGDTAGNDTKPATIETGYVLRVPPFVNEGDLIQVDTRTGEYSTRVKE